MSWLVETFTAKLDDLAYPFRLVRNMPQSKIIPPCEFWDLFSVAPLKKSNSEKLYRESQSDLVKNINKKDA